MRRSERYAKNAKAWRVNAELTFHSSIVLFESGYVSVWFSAAMLGHHALEMLLKSALVQEGFTVAKGKPKDGFVWGHSLVELASLLAAKRADFSLDRVSRTLAQFDAFFNELRYPSELDQVEELSEENKDDLVQVATYIRPFAAPFTGTSFD